MTTDMMNVVIADDHPIYRNGLRRIINKLMSARIAEAENFKELQEQIDISIPNIILLDFIFPGLSGPDSIAKIRAQNPRSVLIVVSMKDDLNTVEQIMQAGANGFISKAVNAETMSSAIEAVLEGDTIRCLENSGEKAAFPELTPRQTDILIHLQRGKTNKEIALELNLSPFTVRSHVSDLFKIFGVNTRTAAVNAALENGII